VARGVLRSAQMGLEDAIDRDALVSFLQHCQLKWGCGGHQRKRPAWQQRPLEARDFHSF